MTRAGAYPSGGDAAIETRAFFPLLGVDEDPVCGSGNGGIADAREKS
jgi:predicted PhzF superfamily epimerase YddE/YHI9